jgi:hypothetical protein
MDEIKILNQKKRKRALVVNALYSYIGTLGTWEDIVGFLNSVSPGTLKVAVKNHLIANIEELQQILKELDSV